MTTPDTEPLAPDGIDTAFVPELGTGVVVVPVEDEAVLYQEQYGSLHLLDPIATVVCSRFDGRTSLGAIVSDLATSFGAPADVITDDVLTMMRDLGAEGLLVGVQGTGEAPARVEEALVDDCR